MSPPMPLRLTPRKSMYPKYEEHHRKSRKHSADINGSIQEDDKPFQVTLSNESFETYELDPPPYTLTTTKEELKQMYHDMVSIR